ncbi:MAG TPA: hypothetical protein PK771_12815, partial [Spirochaetota bacterium]|nr:hypothetical protein [Spirochaetota bacterium]
MNINTGKLASNSELFLKKIKEQDTNNSIDSEKEKSNNIRQKLLNDFADIKYAHDSFKGRLLSNNFKLSKYEYEYSKNQFVEERLESIQKAYDKSDLNGVKEIISNSIFNNKNVLKDYFSDNNSIKDALKNAKAFVDENYKTLNREYKSIEVASQNILSINQDTMVYSLDLLKDLDP